MEISAYERTFRVACASVAISIGLLSPNAVIAESAAEQGLTLASRWCNSCHVVKQNDPGMDDAEIGPPFSNLTTSTAQSLKQLFAGGHADMDALSKLSDAEVAAIAAYLHTLKPEPRTR
jgi:mono/diheme cytochrome c family protein